MKKLLFVLITTLLVQVVSASVGTANQRMAPPKGYNYFKNAPLCSKGYDQYGLCIMCIGYSIDDTWRKEDCSNACGSYGSCYYWEDYADTNGKCKQRGKVACQKE